MSAMHYPKREYPAASAVSTLGRMTTDLPEFSTTVPNRCSVSEQPTCAHGRTSTGVVHIVSTPRANRGRDAVSVGISLTAVHSDASNMAVAESNHIGDVAVKATAHARVGDPDAGRLHAAEAQAVGAVLFRAHDAARHLENLLELEAPDPRVAALMQDAKRLRKSIAALLVEVAIDACELQVPT